MAANKSAQSINLSYADVIEHLHNKTLEAARRVPELPQGSDAWLLMIGRGAAYRDATVWLCEQLGVKAPD